MRPVTMYLANLTHVDNEGHAANKSIPLNIGHLASYLKSHFDSECHIQLFNLPQKLEEALSQKVPDILACSNYMWNFNLNYFYLSEFKAKHPSKITIMGGPNYPGHHEEQAAFLRKYNKIDLYCYLEAEISFLALVKKLAHSEFDLDNVKQANIEGCHSIHKDKFIDGGTGNRIEDIDSIPSPYLNSQLDQFLSDGFVPVLQTNRGCPFTCAYCLCGNKYFSRTYKFDVDRVLKEIDYISKCVQSKSLHITDSNFGLFARDRNIASKLRESRADHGWPLMVNVATAKINKDRVSECLDNLGEAIFFSASMQSLNEKTLKQIKRKNFSFEIYKDIIAKLEKSGVRSLCEFIITMPEETKESHLAAIKEAIDVGVKLIAVHTCILLHNTALRESSQYDQFNMLKKHRVIPRAFGEYQGTKIVETEEVCVATNNMGLDDYIDLRGFHFVLSAFYNFGFFEEIILYLKKMDVSISQWLINLHVLIQHDPGPAGKLYRSFILDAQTELWDNADEMLSYYQQNDNFQKLITGQNGANLILSYQALCLDNLSHFVDLAVTAAAESHGDANPEILDNLRKYIIGLRGNIFDSAEKNITESLGFDIPAWIKSDMADNGSEFKRATNIVFKLAEDKVDVLESYKKLYGNNKNARGKILARIPLDVLCREYHYSDK